ncbi:MAG: WbqC family protein [Paludibacter sp.]|nr:WbqC family protein [Paludibacter sp.]MBP7612062.1 WbqC family protein [Paludibacter sp.]
MGNICLTSAYLAPVEYYSALAKADTVFLEHCEFYEKQSYRNRCNIAGANGQLALTIPVEKSKGARMLTRDVRISEHSDWQLQHWRSIESAYNSTPFFEYYKDDLLPFYEQDWTFLWDFNIEIQAKMLELLDLQVDIQLTKEYKVDFDENVLDARNSIHPKKETDTGSLKNYYQVFEQRFGFIPNLSIIDLLFNMGNESILVLI